jgi:hypothetical protein
VIPRELDVRIRVVPRKRVEDKAVEDADILFIVSLGMLFLGLSMMWRGK